MDVHVPYAISFGLRLREVDVVTSQEDNTAELEDSDLLDRATALGRALFTQDTDFLRIASGLRSSSREPSSVIRTK
jgi:predicted nuclease of predicted toxin-antitoxin system